MSKFFLGVTHMASDADDGDRWRTLAAEARATADGLVDPQAKRIMRDIAKGYELLARRADARRKKDPKDSK
jgi:hypothetical protein